MGYESIAHEAEGRMGYWLMAHEGEWNNFFSKIKLVTQAKIDGPGWKNLVHKYKTRAVMGCRNKQTRRRSDEQILQNHEWKQT